MKNILVAVLFFLPVLCWAQSPTDGSAGGRTTDVARWGKARDYLAGKLALEAIRGKARTDSSIRRRFARVEPVLAGATLEAPLSSAALDASLKDFARVRQVVVEPLSRVDVHAFAAAAVSASASADAARRLVDTAFAIVGRGYTLDASLRGSLEGAVGRFLAVTDTPAHVKAPPAKPVIALGGQPDGQAAALAGHSGRGFDFWVLLPILLLAVVCVVLWRKYVEIKEELRARKMELRSFNENYFSAGGAARGGSGSTGSGSGSSGLDRKGVERLIGDSAVIGELNQAIQRMQARVAQLEGKAPVAVGAGSAAGSAGGSSGSKGKRVEPEKGRPVDGADVFYMAGPVSNYFPNSAKSFTKDNTVYRFKVSANKQEAEFELHTSGAPINEIVQLAESYIKAACDEENLPSYPVRNIITKKVGRAILDGDKWMIKSKALIRYE